MAITIRPVKKQYFDGTHRYRSPDETHAAVEPLMAEIGVSRSLMYPWIVSGSRSFRRFVREQPGIRPRPRREGKEPIHARVSAMMEAIERYCAE